MNEAYVTYQTYSFVQCQIRPYFRVSSTGDKIMFARLHAFLQLRRSTAFLLEREDDHLLRDIGLTRDDLHAMRSADRLFDALVMTSRFRSTPTPRGLPVRSA